MLCIALAISCMMLTITANSKRPNEVISLHSMHDSCILTGGMQDYNYVNAGCMEVTVELSCCKYPNSSYIQSYWEDNVNSLIAYLGQVHMG